MSELVSERIRANAERLKLSHLAEATEQLVERAESQEMGLPATVSDRHFPCQPHAASRRAAAP